MSPLLLATIFLGLLATILFVLGYIRGTKKAIKDHRQPEKVNATVVDNKARYSIPVVIAVVASAVVIALVGVNPNFVYLGPLLAIGTNAAIGFAFFYDRES